MQAETLRDVMDWTRHLHGALAEGLDRSAEQTDRERARMLLEYLAEHERRLQSVVTLSEEDASVKALNTWCYDYFENAPMAPWQARRDFSQASTEEIVRAVMDMHEMVIGLYRYLHGRAESPSSRELVEGLLEIQENETRLISRDVRAMEDL